MFGVTIVYNKQNNKNKILKKKVESDPPFTKTENRTNFFS